MFQFTDYTAERYPTGWGRCPKKSEQYDRDMHKLHYKNWIAFQ
jgi:hypothetical protein